MVSHGEVDLGDIIDWDLIVLMLVCICLWCCYYYLVRSRVVLEECIYFSVLLNFNARKETLASLSVIVNSLQIPSI